MQDALIHLAAAAGREILDVYETPFDVTTKDDASPLTEADLRAHRVIVDGLHELTPDVPVISEEAEPPPFQERRHWERYWLVDPLDGTKEFVGRNGEFTVNIALIEAGEPVVGVVGVPVRGHIYVGDCRANSAFRLSEGGRDPLRTRTMKPGLVTVVASRRHGGGRLAGYLDTLAKSFEIARRPVGSSLKFCLLAEGEADLYPRLGPTSEWDIAAAHAVLQAAGGTVMLTDGAPMRYNAKESFLNPDFVAVGDPGFAWRDHLPK
ncbi:MAG: 3'(2'),5'-bisphosphate nucleotidase CysQ [Gammaproteobacteria bacterium]|nr:3'(2'),5'-bisphosphate nucleotidase CysQ [Gammaproteobacteria bacterium]